MRDLRLWMAAPIATLLLLVASDLALAQPMNVTRVQIIPNQVLTIRMYYHPNLKPPQPVMDIFLKDPNRPVFRLDGGTGNIVETFRHMQELAILFKKQTFTLIVDDSGHRTQTVHPYFDNTTNYSRKMKNIIGFYGIGYPNQGPVPSGGQPGTTKMIPAQPIPLRTDELPPGEPMRERMMHESPPQEQMGFCCVNGEVIKVPANACKMERGTFFRDSETAHQRCRQAGGGR